MEDIERIRKECVTKVGIDENVILEAMRTETPPEGNQLYKDFLRCSYMKQGYQNEDGDILYDNIKQFLSDFYTDEVLKNAVDPCDQVKINDPAENAFAAVKCILGNLKRIESEKVKEEE